MSNWVVHFERVYFLIGGMMRLSILCAFSLLTTACGGNSTGVEPDPSACGFSESNYLPFAVGYQWTYQVTDLVTGARSTKTQSIDSTVSDAMFGEVSIQITNKDTGRTESKIAKVGDALLRFQQQDFDMLGTLERTTTYDPHKIRLDETPARLAMGATYSENYTATVVDSVGSVPTSRVDEWEVLGVDVPCDSPFGQFSCLHLRRLRTAGGVADKGFFFAPGVGKVREVGLNQVEELTGCQTL